MTVKIKLPHSTVRNSSPLRFPTAKTSKTLRTMVKSLSPTAESWTIYYDLIPCEPMPRMSYPWGEQLDIQQVNGVEREHKGRYYQFSVVPTTALAGASILLPKMKEGTLASSSDAVSAVECCGDLTAPIATETSPPTTVAATVATVPQQPDSVGSLWCAGFLWNLYSCGT